MDSARWRRPRGGGTGLAGRARNAVRPDGSATALVRRATPAASAFLLGILALLLVAVVAPANAATWTPTSDVSPSGWWGQDSPRVAVDRQGDSLLAWVACDPSNPGCYYQVLARIQPAVGELGPILTLSPLGASTAWPAVASDDDGDSAVVWEQDSLIVGRTVSATGVLGPLRTLSTTTALNASVVVEPTGRALAVWIEIRSGSYYAVARYLDQDGTLGPVLTLGSSSAEHPAAAMDRAGMATVVWTENFGRVVGRRITPTSVSSSRTIAATATGVGYGMPAVGVDRDGNATISYRRAKEGELPHVRARQWSRANTLGSTLSISQSTDDVTFYSALATDLDGDSTVVWSRRVSSTRTDVLTRRIDRSGTLGKVSKVGIGDRPAVTVDDDGNGLIAWHSPGPPYDATEVYARTVSRGGVLSTTSDKLSSDGRVVRTATSPLGRFSVVWQQRSLPYGIHAAFGQ